MNIIFYLKRVLKYLIFYLNNSDFKEFNSLPKNAGKKLSKKANLILSEGCKIIKSQNLKFRLTDGTILGIYRDGEFIKHDNDMDIDVLVDKSLDEKKIEKFFNSNGFLIGRKVFYKNKIQQIAFFNIESLDIFDIIFWYKKEKSIYNYSERNFERIQELKFFENLPIIDFMNKKYPIPSLTKKWLKMRYGKHWNIPKKSKGDWKEECFDMKRIKMR
tara:strand:- start:1846 stop:2493 length:648 start_codon:yes stop_codon:yes gene_type:complete